MTEPRAVLFDVFGTIVDWRSSLVDELGAFGRRRAIAADWAGLVDAWRGAYVPAMDRVRRGERPWTKLDDLQRESLARLVGEFDIGGLSSADLDLINRGWRRLRPWPDCVAGLTRLRRKFIIAPLSNGDVALLLDMARHAGLPWDMIFGSDLFRHYKPDPETYLGACALLALRPAEVMLCAAHNSDLHMARSLGLATAFVARPTEYGPRQAHDLSAEEAWDYVVDSLEDLADQLGAPN